MLVKQFDVLLLTLASMRHCEKGFSGSTALHKPAVLPVSIFANYITDLLPFVQIWTLRFVP